MFEFTSVEEMQAHYRAVRRRIETAQPKFRAKPPEKALEAPPSEPLPLVLLESPKPPPAPAVCDPVGSWDENGNLVTESKAKKAKLDPDDQPTPLPRIRLQELTTLVCGSMNISQLLIWSPRRTKELTRARFLIWALAREFCHQHSLPTIGKFSSRDHTTVLHGAAEGKKLPAYPELARLVQEILDQRAKELAP